MFNENVMGIIFLAVIVGIPVVIAALGPVFAHKKINLRDITPILIQACQQFVALKAEAAANFEQFEADVISLLVGQVHSIKELTPDEKALVTPDIAKILLHKHLQQVFNEKQQVK